MKAIPLRLLLVCTALAAPAMPASAHEYWLSPSTYRCAPGDTAAIRVLVGTGFRGEPKPYTPRRAVRFTFEAARSIDLLPVGVNGEMVWARIRSIDALGAVVAYESNDTYIELPAADFDRYLALEGLTGPQAVRAARSAAAGPGRELYRRSCKTWLAGSDAARVTRASGLPLEILPDADPTTAARVSFRVFYEGKPLPNALVRAWRGPLGSGLSPVAAAERDSVGPAAQTRTDAAGHAALDLPGAGEFLLSTVQMVPASDPAEADWRSTWGSFTFARATAPRRR
ncbi:MAG: DUF4198 domain-containing protein [Candidatus Eisenbacteria bacterium]